MIFGYILDSNCTFIENSQSIVGTKENTPKDSLVPMIDHSTPQRTINYSCNQLNDPVRTSRQMSLKNKPKMNEYAIYTSIHREGGGQQVSTKPNIIKEHKNASSISMYSHCHPINFFGLDSHTGTYVMLRGNYDLGQALNYINPKEFVPLEGVSLAINQRKGLYAASFK